MNLKFYLEGKGRVTYANCQLRAPHTLGARKEGLLKAQREAHELGSLLCLDLIVPYSGCYGLLLIVGSQPALQHPDTPSELCPQAGEISPLCT